MALGFFGLTQDAGGASDFSITQPGTHIGQPITGLIGMQALTLWMKFAYGSGGTALKAYLQTSIDQGNTWLDIACMAFAQVSRTALVNLSGLTPKTTLVIPTDGTLTDDTVVDGLLGDRVRLKAIVTGTYAANTLLSGRMVAR